MVDDRRSLGPESSGVNEPESTPADPGRLLWSMLERAGSATTLSLPCRFAVESLGAAHAVLLVCAANGDALEPAASAGFTEGASRRALLHWSHRLGAWVMRARAAVAVLDPQADPRFPTAPSGLRRARAFPLSVGDEVAGVFVLLDERPGRDEEDYERRVSAVTAIAAAGVLVRRYARRVDELSQAVEELEGQARRLERRAALGDFTAEAAREIEAPLESLGGLAAKVREGYDASEPRLILLEIMEGEIARLRRVLSGLLDTARAEPTDHPPGDVNHILSETITLVTAEMQAVHARLSRKLASPLPNLRLDPDLLRRVLLNVFRAVLQGLPEEGRVRVESRRSGDHVEIVIAADAPREAGGILDGLWFPFLADGRDTDEPSAQAFRRLLEDYEGRVRVYSNREWPLVAVLAFPIAPNRERRRSTERRRAA